MMRLDLDGLAAASREALMAEWREVVGSASPKHLSKPLMIQILSTLIRWIMWADIPSVWMVNLRVLHGAMVRPAFKPGSRFVREYHGVTHVVEVSDDGRCKRIRALSPSHTARTITGYNVSGFKFFGVST